MAADQVTEDGRRNPSAGADFAALAPEAAGVRKQGGVRPNHVPDHFRPGIPFGTEARGASLAPENVPRVPHVAGKRHERRSRQHAAGKVLGQDKEAVAFHVVGLNGGGAAGGVRVMVLRHGFRNVEAFPTGPAGAQAQVGVFAVEKKILVKAAEFFEHGAAVERRRTAGQKRFFIHWEILGGPAEAALLAAAIAGDQHARGIQTRLAEQPNLRGAHAGIGAALQGAHQGIQPTGMSHGVVIQGSEIWSGRCAEALVDVGAEAVVALVLDDTRSAARLVAAHQALAAVVYDDHFEIAPRLAAWDSTHSRSLESAARVGITTVTRKSGIGLSASHL